MSKFRAEDQNFFFASAQSLVGVTDSVADGGARSTEKLSWRDKSSAPPPEKEEEEKGEGATEEEEKESSSSTTLLLDSATEGISDVGRD